MFTDKVQVTYFISSVIFRLYKFLQTVCNKSYIIVKKIVPELTFKCYNTTINVNSIINIIPQYNPLVSYIFLRNS